MLILAFDTATAWGRFALAADGHVLAELPHNVTGSYADALLPIVGRLLAAAGRDLRDVEVVAVTSGPGSFTGVRIGMATAKGLAYGLGARLIAVPTLAAMAAALLERSPERELAVPVLDARRGEIFAAVYRRHGVWVDEVLAPAALSPDAWWGRIREAVSDVEAPVWGGSGLALLVGAGPELRPEFLARGEPALRGWSAAHPATARALALAASDPAAGLASIHPFVAAPLYLRASEAEIKRDLDLTPRAPADPGAGPGRGLVNGGVPALSVRIARTEDLRAVERIERRSFADPWPGEALYDELQADALRLPIVAERAGTVVGYLMAWRCGNELHILNLAVAPEERRHGTGSLLLSAILDEARVRGMALATLEVRESNGGARAFYLRHGFAAVGRRAAYYRDNGEDAIIMSRPVDAPDD